jgi:hypothetical protein
VTEGEVGRLARRQKIMGSFCKNATVVLVHGAWADGSSWNRVILPLSHQGLKVILCADSPDISLRRRRCT